MRAKHLVVLATMGLALTGCQNHGLVDTTPTTSVASTAQPSPLPTPSAAPSTTGAPIGMPIVSGSPTPTPEQSTVTTSPSPAQQVVINATRNITFTPSAGKGTFKTVVTKVVCENNLPVSGLWVIGPVRSGQTEGDETSPYGEVELGANPFTTIKLTHRIRSADNFFSIHFGCGDSNGEWTYDNEMWPMAVGNHTVNCYKDGRCYVDGFGRAS